MSWLALPRTAVLKAKTVSWAWVWLQAPVRVRKLSSPPSTLQRTCLHHGGVALAWSSTDT